AEVPARDRERIERREVSGLATRFHVKLGANTAYKFRLAARCRKHTGKEKKIAGLHRFCISAERLGWGWEFDAEFLQPLLGRGRVIVFASYPFPLCAPPSTCSTSPVTCRASVR